MVDGMRITTKSISFVPQTYRVNKKMNNQRSLFVRHWIKLSSRSKTQLKKDITVFVNVNF